MPFCSETGLSRGWCYGEHGVDGMSGTEGRKEVGSTEMVSDGICGVARTEPETIDGRSDI